MAEPVRVGLMGCGAIGRVHARRLHANPRVRLVGFLDPHTRAAVALRDDCAPEALATNDEHQLLELRELDAVVLCSPTQAHWRQASAALERGLHVLCEKPLATSRAEIEDLIHRRDSAQRLLSVSYQRRYQAIYKTARRELRENSELYGPLISIHLFVCEHWQQTIRNTWRDDPSVGAGYFGDAGSHQIDSILFVTDAQLQQVYAQGERHGSNVEVTTRVLAQLSQDIQLCAHFVGNAHHWREDIHFHGRDADLLLRDGKIWRCRENQVENIVDILPDDDPDSAFIEAVLTGTGTESPAECALPMFDWTQAVLQSLADPGWKAV